MRSVPRTWFAVLACVVLAPARLRAGEVSLQSTEENDIFCGCGLDRHYTQGFRATFETSRAPHRVRWTVGQTVYTPGDLSRSDLITGDRPYSGWLWLGPEIVTETPTALRTARLYVGGTGKASFAKESQRWVHRVIGAPDPKGWDHQLRAQVGANLFLDRQRRLRITRRGAFLDVDAMPRVSLAMGNIFDHVEAGAQLRIGRLDSAPWGDPPIPSYMAGEGYGGGHYGLRLTEAYLVAAATGRAAAYDYSLQGDGARERFDIRPHALIGWWEAGLGLGFRRLKLEFRWVVRSPDFAPVRDPQGYGSLRLGLR